MAKHLLHNTYLELLLPAPRMLLRSSLQLLLFLLVLLEFALLPATLFQSQTSSSLITAITASQRAAIDMFAIILSVTPVQVAAMILEKVVDGDEALDIVIRGTPVTSVVYTPQRADIVLQIMVVHVFIVVEVPALLAGLEARAAVVCVILFCAKSVRISNELRLESIVHR